MMCHLTPDAADLATRTMNVSQHCRWHPQAGPAELKQYALSAIRQAAEQSIRQRGSFHLVLAGGSTPRQVYAELHNTETDWSRWHIYFGDERCLPPEHAERNSRMAAEVWLDHVAIPAAQVHNIPAEHGATAAAAEYAAILSDANTFDLVLLGLGEDGHTASLFPDHVWGAETTAPAALPVFDAPKPPSERVTLSVHRLSAARQVLFLVSGASKRDALQAWMRGDAIPAGAIAPPNGVDVVYNLN